jgi:thiosulfate/3-mercaptopyruvate sulfurtransferase
MNWRCDLLNRESTEWFTPAFLKMENKIHSPLISARELHRVAKNAVIIDARAGADAYDRFLLQHLVNAQWVDLETDLSQKSGDPSHRGRHPLTGVKQFAALLGRLGIDPAADVIVYDDKNGAFAAARFWWMMKAVGHEKIRLLDGGLAAAVREGIPVSNKMYFPVQQPAYPATHWLLPVADMQEVDEARTMQDHLVIDVREAYRYLGESEPIDLVAGHIPGAVNVPYLSNLDEQGNFLPAEKLAEKYQLLIGNRSPQSVIVHCGSGVTACHTLLALEQAGIPGSKLYEGSWSEWSRNKKPVAKGES